MKKRLAYIIIISVLALYAVLLYADFPYKGIVQIVLLFALALGLMLSGKIKR